MHQIKTKRLMIGLYKIIFILGYFPFYPISWKTTKNKIKNEFVHNIKIQNF